MIATVKPPGPKNPPVIGHLAAFRSRPLQFMQRIAREYGGFAYFRVARMNMYLVTEPELVREILVRQQHSFVKSRMLQRAKILLGEGLLTSEGQHHIRQRRLVQPAFHRDRLAGYAEIMSRYAERTRGRWHAGDTFDVAEQMMHLTLSVVAKTLFDADVESEAGDIGKALTEILGLFDLMVLPFSEWIERLRLPPVRRMERARARLDATIYRIIEERRASGVDKGDLLSMLMLAQDEEASGGMDDRQIRDEAMTLFLAGHETTANLLTWTWYLLSQNPECEARLHEEVDRVLGGRTPAMEDVAELKYVEMVVAESMRLYPPAWAIGRMAVQDVTIGDYEVPSGSICIMGTYVIHRDPRFYPDPERFDPERWMPEARQARPKFSYVPFGGGARVCIGEGFAWTEGILIVATLAQKWKLRLVPGHRVEPLPLITLRAKYGMQMRVESR